MVGSSSAPSAPAALPAAAQWIEALLLGGVGTTVAVLGIAGIGLAMLAGRVSARRGMGAVLGCFVLFGAPAIADGLEGLARRSSAPPTIAPPAPLPSVTPPPAPAANSDPYAGASIPM